MEFYGLNRRTFLRLAAGSVAALPAILAACGGEAAPASTAASPSSPPSPSASVAAKPAASGGAASRVAIAAPSAAAPKAPAEWQDQLNKTIEAAKQEGTLNIDIQPGAFPNWVAEFGKKYPFLKIESAQLFGAQFVARVLPEQQAGKFLWDIHLGGPNSAYTSLVPAKALDPLLPSILLPEILDDSKWFNGFNDGFCDDAGKYIYSLQGEVERGVQVNRDFVPKSDLDTIEGLLDPKWKGKLSAYDPRIAGVGSADGAHFIEVKGADFWRQFLQTQPALTQDRRQQTEWLVRGTYPITFGPSSDVIAEYQKQGLAKNMEFLGENTDLGHRMLYSFSVMLVAKAPHPNAAKLFINWAMSQEGQTLMQSIANTGSRRLDAPQVPGIVKLDPNTKYFPPTNKQANEHFNSDAIKIAKEVLK